MFFERGNRLVYLLLHTVLSFHLGYLWEKNAKIITEEWPQSCQLIERERCLKINLPQKKATDLSLFWTAKVSTWPSILLKDCPEKDDIPPSIKYIYIYLLWPKNISNVALKSETLLASFLKKRINIRRFFVTQKCTLDIVILHALQVLHIKCNGEKKIVSLGCSVNQCHCRKNR